MLDAVNNVRDNDSYPTQIRQRMIRFPCPIRSLFCAPFVTPPGCGGQRKLTKPQGKVSNNPN
jgi:hypothetical protein